jgi:hypothetical protein
MAGAAVGHGRGRRVDDGAEYRGALGRGDPAGEGVEVGQGLSRAGGAQQHRLAGRAELAHDRRGGQAAADAVADDDADPVAGHRDHVVPVPAHLQRFYRRDISRGEAVRQLGGAEDGLLQRQRDRAGLRVVTGPGQHLG